MEYNVVVKWRAGLHARPASELVKTANKFRSKIIIKSDSDQVDAKSVLGIMTLGAVYKTPLKIIATGDDEREAIEAVTAIFENNEID